MSNYLKVKLSFPVILTQKMMMMTKTMTTMTSTKMQMKTWT